MPQFYFNCGYVPVSSDFIENYMPKANATFVKIYLYALNLAVTGKSVEYSAIAKELNLLESDVLQAFNYWQEAGVLTVSGDSVTFEITSSSDTQAPKTSRQQAPRASRPGYAPGEAARAISDNANLSDMVMLAQEILGKTLNPTDVETLYWFFDGLKFSPEVILMLLEYCVSKDKRRMSYIEKVAVSWHERGITTMEAVNDYIQKESERTSYVYSIRKALGITDRALSQNEEQFINRWRDMYKMEEPMVSYAYEQCIMQTAKLSFPYMEKILERWHKQGIHTVEQAQKDSREFKNSHGGDSSGTDYEIYSDNYDHNSLEQLTRRKYDFD